MDLDCKVREKNAGLCNEVLPEAITFHTRTMLTMRRFAERSKRTLENMMEWTPGPGQKIETKMVWLRLKVFWFSKDNPTGQSERKKKRQTKEEEGRQYQRVDRNGPYQLN